MTHPRFVHSSYSLTLYLYSTRPRTVAKLLASDISPTAGLARARIGTVFARFNSMQPSHSAQGFTCALIARCLAVPLLVEAAAKGLLAVDSGFSEHIMARAVFTLILATALLPLPDPARSSTGRLLLLWSLLNGASLVAGLLWSATTTQDTVALVPLASGTALLVFLFGCLRWSLALRLADRRKAAQISLVTLLLSLTLPLWAAPLALLQGAGKWLVDTIIALCPVSYLAALAQIDYLRSDWMYRNTPYGSLRFDYPDPLYATIALLAALIIIRASVRLPGHDNGRLAAAAPQLLEIKS